jgi:hypothetical protein
MNIEKVRKRLTKLLALSASPVEAEAQAAMDKCKELMEKYNIRTIDIDEENKTANVRDEVVDGSTKQVSSWESALGAAIAKCFDGKSIINKSGGSWRMIFIAGDTDIEIIVDLFKRVRRVVSKKAKEYASTHIGNARTLKHNYSIGMVSTVYDRLKLIYTDTPETTALVPIKEQAIEDHMKKVVGKTTKRRTTATIRDEEAFRSGVRDGHSIKLNKSIKSESTTGALA